MTPCPGAVRRPARTAARPHLLPVLLLVLLLGLLWPVVTARPAAARTGASIAVARLLNQERVAHGLPPLHVRDRLNQVAHQQAERMADRATLFHNPHLAADVPGRWRWVGENVGVGPDVRTVHAAFVESPGHRANMLDRDFDDVGTAAVRRGDRVWVVQVFRGW